MNRGYFNAAIMCMSIFAAGAIMLGIAPNFIIMMEEFGVGAMGVGFLTMAFILGFVAFGGLMYFRATKFMGLNLRKIVAVGTAYVGIFGILTAFADYWTMWVLRFIIGFSSIMLSVCMMSLAVNWFIDKLNTIALAGIISLILGGVVATFFGSMITQALPSVDLYFIGILTGGWRCMHLIFGGIGLLAFILWIIFGKSAPTANDGSGLVSSNNQPPRILKNRYVWCSAGMLYMLLCFLGVFTFLFVALAGHFDIAVMSKSMVFPTEVYLSAIFNGVVIIFAGLMTLRLLMKTGKRKRFGVIPGFLAPIVGLVVFSLPFSGVWIGVILELLVLVVILLVIVIPTWIVQLQELPGIGFDIIFNTIGAILLISGIAGAIVPITIGWALDQGWMAFKIALYFFILTWAVCGLGSLLIRKPGE